MSERSDIKVRALFRDPEKYADKEIVLSGWARQNRASNHFGFIQLNDGSFFTPVQVVYEQENLDNFDEIAGLALSSGVKVTGKFVLTPDARQPFEIHASTIEVLAESSTEYPLQNKRHSMEFLREIAHLRPRSNTFAAVFRVRSMIAYAIHKFFQEQGFVYVHTPIITESDAEGAGEMFRVTSLDPENPPRTEDGKIDWSKDFFGKPTNLTVSGQLEAEIFALAFRDVYTFGPTFRAENSNTQRHAAEFWMIEPEIAFADLEDAMDLAEAMVKYILRYVMENAPEEMDFFSTRIDRGLEERLKNVVDWGCDLQTEHERYLTEEVFKKPVFVTDYPKDIKAFYMRLNDDGKTVAASDLLVPGIGEIIGGSQREERLDILDARMDELGMDKGNYWWYRELRKYGGVKHAGYGLGFERMIMYATGMSNIRDVLPFPRTPKAAEF